MVKKVAENEIQQAWSVWIDEKNKIITVKKSQNGKEIFFENKDIGTKAITNLVSKGYKIG